MKDIIDFATWYSGTDQEKVKRAYVNYLNAKIEDNNREDEDDEGDIYDAVLSFRRNEELQAKLAEAEAALLKRTL